MLQTFPKLDDDSKNGRLNLSFRATENWPEFLGTKGLTLLLGDDTAGPYVYFSSSKPMHEQMKVGVAHGHDADNWRISIQGTTNVGKYAYTERQFRFQDGGIPYPGDNFTWGPEGGFGIVIFADRRGFPVRPVDPAVSAKAAAAQQPMVERLNIELTHPCPGAPAIRTTLGTTQHGHLDSSFDIAASWPEIAPGTRAAVAILGEPNVGPVMVMLHSIPGAQLVPAYSLTSETLHIVVDGTCQVAGETKRVGEFWTQAAGPQPQVITGTEGASHVVLIGNRQSVAGINATKADTWGSTWVDKLREITAELRGQI